MIPEHPPTGLEVEVVDDAIQPAALSVEQAQAELARRKAQPGGYDVAAASEIYAAAYPDEVVPVEDEAAYVARVAAEVGTLTTALSQQLGAEVDELRAIYREFEERRGEEHDATKTRQVLEGWYGRDLDGKLDRARALVQQAPSEVVEARLERTGAGNHPRIIKRVIEWAEARARG